ncbi:hypothetical protein Drorol1_Dr00003785, partial [Drosera rotundifolia]
MEQRKHNVLDNKEGDEILVGVPFNVGSTSKSSSEWRSLMQDSTTDDPFSSSSRRNGSGRGQSVANPTRCHPPGKRLGRLKSGSVGIMSKPT